MTEPILTQAIDAFETVLLSFTPPEAKSDGTYLIDELKIESLPNATLALSGAENGCLRLFDRTSGELKALLRNFSRASQGSRVLTGVLVELAPSTDPNDLRVGDVVRSAFGAYDWKLLEENLRKLSGGVGGGGEIYVDTRVAEALAEAKAYADVGDVRTLAEAVKRANEAAREALCMAKTVCHTSDEQVLAAANAYTDDALSANVPASSIDERLAPLLEDIMRTLRDLRREARRQTFLLCEELGVSYSQCEQVEQDYERETCNDEARNHED